MKKFVTYPIFFITASPVGIESLKSLCVNILQFGSSKINPSGTLVTVSTCSKTYYTETKADWLCILDRLQFRNNSSMAA